MTLGTAGVRKWLSRLDLRHGAPNMRFGATLGRRYWSRLRVPGQIQANPTKSDHRITELIMNPPSPRLKAKIPNNGGAFMNFVSKKACICPVNIGCHTLKTHKVPVFIGLSQVCCHVTGCVTPQNLKNHQCSCGLSHCHTFRGGEIPGLENYCLPGRLGAESPNAKGRSPKAFGTRTNQTDQTVKHKFHGLS
jgi:hypothetical protein